MEEKKYGEDLEKIKENIDGMSTKDKYKLMFAQAADEKDAKKKSSSSPVRRIIDKFKTARDDLRNLSDAIIEEREKEFNYIPENKKRDEIINGIKDDWQETKNKLKSLNRPSNDKKSLNKAEEIKKLEENLNMYDPNWRNTWEITYDEKTGANIKPLKSAPSRAIMSATLKEAKPKTPEEHVLSGKMDTINALRKLHDEGKVVDSANEAEFMKKLGKDYDQYLTDYALKKMKN